MILSTVRDRYRDYAATPHAFAVSREPRIDGMGSYALRSVFASAKRGERSTGNETTSTLHVRVTVSRRADLNRFASWKSRFSEYKNEGHSVINHAVLSLLASPNRGLNGFLGDVTVAIGGF